MRLSLRTVRVGWLPVVAAAALAACGGEAPPAPEAEVSLAGAIDFHAHSGPDSRPRSVNDVEAARAAQAAGMRGLVLKNHYTTTAGRAALAMARVDGIELFGGVVLNRSMGGLNAEAVRHMVWDEGGRGKVVWLPTFDAEYYITRDGSSEPYVSVVVDGQPAPEIEEIFSLVAEHDLVLCTGHSSPEEVLLLLPEMQRLGVQNILITHVFGQNPTLDQMRSMADAGAVMEIDWLAVFSGGRTIEEYVEAIDAIGAEHFLMSSDLGQAGNPLHADGLRDYVRALRAAGVTDADIDTMLNVNPARLLGLAQ